MISMRIVFEMLFLLIISCSESNFDCNYGQYVKYYK